MTVLVTGSSRGIGREIARQFARNGECVILNSAHNTEQLQQTYDDFIVMGYNVLQCVADVSRYECCVDLFDFILQNTGNYPDVVINNAGIGYTALFTETPPDVWNKIINSNLNSAYYCSYLAAPHMIRQHQGNIINISSIWGSIGASCEVAYSTSKSGLHGLTKALAKELGTSNIRVNAIACGWIDTDMNLLYSSKDRLLFLENVPLMRAGTVADVANLCWYLAQDSSSYLTGQIITLDGGLT
ncbi:MAG: short-chain dehydrogenase [Epulopiscium sp. Nuni2H_MBin001]|nr:MAG: short-chain dehydrogenase [Epulopiscium sp. Nuni2H_MBin001]